MMKTMKCLGFAFACLGLTACQDDPCDEGYELRDGLCWVVRPDAGASAVDAGGDTAAVATPGFGSPCLDDVAFSDCASPANICLKQSPDAPGFCSAVGCDLNKDICPADWTCIDLSMFKPGAPSGCVKL
jgi:hypothetical protein